MSYQQGFICDICGAVRGPSNHWLLTWMPEFNDGKLYFTEWNDLDAHVNHTGHLCGEQCAAKHLSNYLGKLKEGS